LEIKNAYFGIIKNERRNATVFIRVQVTDRVPEI